MKRFVKEYASYKLANNPFLPNSVRGQYYVYRINKAVKNYERGLIVADDAIDMILNAEQYAEQEAKTE